MSKQVNVDFVTRQIKVDTDGKEYYVSAAVAAKDAEASMLNAQNAATQSETAANEVKEIYNDGNFTPLSDLLGGLGTKLKRWGSIFANKVFASNLPIVYNSVAEMKADTMLWEGMNTKTLGYYTPNDGGGASYIIRAKADADVDDGGSLHELANGLVAELIIENGTINLRQFGAKGNYNNDDTVSFLNAINYMQRTKSKLIVPLGDFRITSSYKMTDESIRFFHIEGINVTGSVIRADFSGDYILNFKLPDGASTLQDMIVKNITFIANAPETFVGAIIMNRNQNALIENCFFRGFNHSIIAKYSWGLTIRKCSFFEQLEVYDSALAQHLDLGAQCNAVVVQECAFDGISGGTSHSITIHGGQSNVLIIGCSLQEAKGILINAGTTGNITNVAIRDTYFEWMDGPCVEVDRGPQNIFGLLIDNCYLNGATNLSQEYAIDIQQAVNVTVSNCVATRFVKAIIDNVYSTATGLTVINCKSEDNGVTVTSGPHTYVIYGTSVPNTGYWRQGTICYNRTPTAGNKIGWICVADGTPGTWKEFGTIDA